MKKRFKGLISIWLVAILLIGMLPVQATATDTDQSATTTHVCFLYTGTQALIGLGDDDFFDALEQYTISTLQTNVPLHEQESLQAAHAENVAQTGWRLWGVSSGEVGILLAGEYEYNDPISDADIDLLQGSLVVIEPMWAALSINKYTVTYKADGEVVDTVEVEHGKDATAPEIPAKAGHTALWDKDSKNITADTVINAVYTINKYTVTYKADGEVVDTVEVEHGKDATAPEIPAKAGHTALWDKDGKNITADTEINAIYTINKYTVTYKADGEVVDTVEVEHGKDATAPEIPAKTGYTAAWDKDGKNITADTEINAVYTINKYTVTYKADGEVVDTVKVEHGQDATAPEIPAKEGYNETAPKWDKDGKNITADTEINAVYTKNQPGEYADVTPDTNVGGGKVAEEIEELKEKVPFTQEEEKQIEHGADVEVWLEIKDISDSVSSEDKANVEEKLGDADVALYLDIAMFKQVGENEASRLTQLSDKVQITFKLADSLINTDKNVTRTYSIIHVHDGKAEVITPVFDAATKTLTFETDRFSTYGVVYTDEKITPPAEETVPPTEETTPPTEETTPPADTPATGDSFQPVFWTSVMVLSAAAVAVLLVEQKKRRTN